jgi:hypothetical protein
VAATALGTNVGLDDLGVTSLLNLRLSQRLRRFIGREFSPFVLSRNPTVASLAAALSGPGAAAAAATAAAAPQVLSDHRPVPDKNAPLN